MDRALDFGSSLWGFKSSRGYHQPSNVLVVKLDIIQVYET